MESLDGAISNLSDSWDAFFINWRQGATDDIKDAFVAVGDAINEFKRCFQSNGKMAKYIDAGIKLNL